LLDQLSFIDVCQKKVKKQKNAIFKNCEYLYKAKFESRMSLEFGLFGLDALGGFDKDLSHDSVTDFQDILEMSLEDGMAECVVGAGHIKPEQSTPLTGWEEDTDEFLQAMLTGSDLGPESLLGSDTSSDSGVLEDTRTLMSPGLDDGPRNMMMSPGLDSPLPHSPADSYDIIDYISNNDSDDCDSMMTTMNPVTGVVDPLDFAMQPVIRSMQPESVRSVKPAASFEVTNLDPVISTTTGTTTIILPAIGANHNNIGGTGMTFSHRLAPREAGPATKRRRVSASSSDSGVEDNKYPRVDLNEEEMRMAVKEGMSFPKYYPLTREEERNLKKIRRKIRNKLSAQDSRKRKREYLDSMEDRVAICSDENKELKDKIRTLESQNKTLAAQLRRLHQMVVNGGMRQGQTSTALMVLLLSTALFLIPGIRDQESKSELDIQAAVKMPPMPGQSRSLLQFDPIEHNDIADLADFEEEVKSEPGMKDMMIEVETSDAAAPRHTDHDYTAMYVPGMKIEPGKAWIDEDAPPMGYGRAVKLEEVSEVEVVEDRHLNVNVSSSGQGTRTVVLQIPKDIK